jgi:hypothetical protein
MNLLSEIEDCTVSRTACNRTLDLKFNHHALRKDWRLREHIRHRPAFVEMGKHSVLV